MKAPGEVAPNDSTLISANKCEGQEFISEQQRGKNVNFRIFRTTT
jgi:hypothetical protein